MSTILGLNRGLNNIFVFSMEEPVFLTLSELTKDTNSGMTYMYHPT